MEFEGMATSASLIHTFKQGRSKKRLAACMINRSCDYSYILQALGNSGNTQDCKESWKTLFVFEMYSASKPLR